MCWTLTRRVNPSEKKRSIDQGDSAAPFQFVACADDWLGPLVQRWQEEGRGAALDDGRFITHLIFADNVWPSSASTTGLVEKIREVNEALAVAGWRVKMTDVHWCATLDCPDAEGANPFLDFGHGEVGMEDRRLGLEVLGTHSPMVRRATTEFQHRVNKAWNAFWAHKTKRDCRMATRAQRIKTLDRIISPVLLYACQVWHPTVNKIDPAERCAIANVDDHFAFTSYLD